MAETKDEAPVALPPSPEDSLVQAARKVLLTGDPWLKAKYSQLAADLWNQGSITLTYSPRDNAVVPPRPARSNMVQLVAPQRMPKLGKGGSLQSRQALLHSLAHIESWAIDLSWDIIARFGRQEDMPRDFFNDFVKVAEDEGRHFYLLATRLEALGSSYGSFTAHDGLWDSADATSKDFAARLAIEHCVHEARGLDVLPETIRRFRNGGDNVTADLLEEVIYPEEITHCATGIRWFTYVSLRGRGLLGTLPQDDASHEYVVENFHTVVKKHFRGPLKPPFNMEAREAAGFPQEWYLPLAVKE